LNEREALAILSEKTRWKIARLLAEEALCGNGIAARLGITKAAVSQHIRKLIKAGLVESKTDGYWLHHYVRPDRLIEIQRLLSDLIASMKDPVLCEPLKNRGQQPKKELMPSCKKCTDSTNPKNPMQKQGE
jgi:ArsR family transcriptional regulator, arsenate/arsenite/antimonite-responsive transcriptional repressor